MTQPPRLYPDRSAHRHRDHRTHGGNGHTPLRRLDLSRPTPAAQVVTSTLIYAQRQAISRQADTRVAFDVANNELRIHEDSTNDNIINFNERVTVHSPPRGYHFRPRGRSGAAHGRERRELHPNPGAAPDSGLPPRRDRQ